MWKYIGNTIISRTDAKAFTNEITKDISKFSSIGASWEVQYKPLIGKDGQLVFTALIVYTKED